MRHLALWLCPSETPWSTELRQPAVILPQDRGTASSASFMAVMIFTAIYQTEQMNANVCLRNADHCGRSPPHHKGGQRRCLPVIGTQADRPLFRRSPFRRCCRSSGVEHSLGKGEVESSNLSGSTIKSSTCLASVFLSWQKLPSSDPRCDVGLKLWMMVAVHVFDHFQVRFGILGNVPSSEEAREAARNANGQTAFSRLGLASTPPMDDAGLRIHTAAQGIRLKAD